VRFLPAKKDLIDFADENFITIKFIPDTKEVLTRI
jgi:hypothetical protein